MKAIFAVLFLAIAAVVLAAPAGQLAIDRLPWLSDAMKAPCAKTEFEYRLAVGRLSAEPVDIPLTKYNAVSIIPEPLASGLLVHVVIRLKPGQVPVVWGKLTGSTEQVLRYTGGCMIRRFGDEPTFPNSRNFMLALYTEGAAGQPPQLVVTLAVPNAAEYVPLKATLAQQAEFMNRLRHN